MPELPDENAAIVSFGYEAGQLKKLPRAGWLLTGITSPESVAEHSFRVAVLAYAIAVQEGGNPDHAAALGLFHDFPEARTGDVPSVGKAYVRLTDPNHVIADQAAALPPALAAYITALVAEHEAAKAPARPWSPVAPAMLTSSNASCRPVSARRKVTSSSSPGSTP